MPDERLPILARPETVMKSHFDSDELRLYEAAKGDKSGAIALVNWSAPSMAAYLVKNWLIPVVLGSMGLVTLITLGFIRNPFGRFFAGILLVVGGVMLIVLEARLWLRTYTRYIVTPDRVIQMQGIVNRSASSVGLLAITDLNDKVGILGQFLDYGTITIETANEASKFRELVDVPKPLRFLEWLDYARDNKVRPPKPTPLNDAAMKALISISTLITEGGLVVEKSESGGWRLKNDPKPPETK
jgi:membrane protein YdbS with pleckstrin-like domain